MPPTQTEISQVLGDYNKAAPAGYALAMHIQFTTPKFLFQTYKKKWLDYYSQNGLVMSDPIVAWSFENVGIRRWSELDDPAGVFAKSAEHGMKYGLVYATDAGNSRSMAGFSRSDREFTDEEAAEMIEAFDALHAATADQAHLTNKVVDQLRKMSVMVTHPGS